MFIFTSVGAALLLAANVVAQLSINTPPTAVVCEPLLITWSRGTPPYFLSVVPAKQPATALVDFGTQTGTSHTWVVNIAAGSQVVLVIRDSTGTVSRSGPLSIQAGISTTCIGQNGTVTSSATTTVAAVTTTPSDASSTSLISSTPDNAATPSNTAAVVANTGKQAPIGAIVGGAVGGLAVVLLFTLGLVYIRRQKQAQAPVNNSQANGAAFTDGSER